MTQMCISYAAVYIDIVRISASLTFASLEKFDTVYIYVFSMQFVTIN